MERKIAINGLGRIGKLVFQYLVESHEYHSGNVKIVAINDLTDVKELVHLLKHDTVQTTLADKGLFIEAIVDPDEEKKRQGYIHIGENFIPVYAQPDPTKLPWGELDVDVVYECTGRFAEYEKAKQHITAGAKHVMVNAPVKGTPNIVYNINSDTLTGEEDIICGASCTTNCLAPLAKILDDTFGIKQGMMATIHAITNDQNAQDAPHKKGEMSRRDRASAWNIVPTTTGAAEAVAKALPQLKGKLTGMAYRVPVLTGSIVNFDVVLNKANITANDINQVIIAKADNESISYTNEPLVSSDIIGCEFGSYVDLLSTKVLPSVDENTTFVQVVSWYDNEASYTHQYVKTLLYWINTEKFIPAKWEF